MAYYAWRIRVPARNPARNTLPETLTAMSDQPKKRILVVDDEPRMVRFVKMNLDLEGYITLEANDGMEALQKVRDYNPDLVLMDVEMPGMDGFETLKRLRHQRRGCDHADCALG